MEKKSILDQAIENLGMSIDKRLLNAEFWQSTASIENYCHAILANFPGKEKETVIVQFKTGQGAHVTSNQERRNIIVLPSIPFSVSAEHKKEFIDKAIIFRSIVLRHELAHILFSNWKAKSTLTKNEMHSVYACVEDSRVENLFSKTMKGARFNFQRYTRPFREINRFNIENIPTINSLFRAFIFFAQDLDFTSNQITDAYKAFYEKHKSVLDELDPVKACKVYKEMYAEAVEIVKELKKTVKIERLTDIVPDDDAENEQPSPMMDDETECEGDSNNDEDSSIEDTESDYEEDEDSSIEDVDNDEIKTVEEEISDVIQEAVEEAETEGEESAEEGDVDEVEVEKDAEEKATKNPTDSADADAAEKEEEEEDESAPDNSSNGGDSSKSEDRDVEEDGEQEKTDEELEEEIENEIEDSDIMETFEHEFRTMNRNDGWVRAENVELNFESIQFSVAELYASYLWKKVNTQLFNANSGQMDYRKATVTYGKAINELTRLFKLKLQNKNRAHQLHFREEGDIDQANLKEFIVNPDSPRGFIKKWKTVTPASNIMILIDASGSMNKKIHTCFINAVILMETCKRLNINYQISLFSTRMYNINVKNNMTINAKLVGKNIEVHKKGDGGTNLFMKDGCKCFLLTLKRFDEKHSFVHETILGNCLDKTKFSKKWMGSTPEFEAFHYLYNYYKKMNNTIMFIINDGGYDSVKEFRDIQRNLYISGYNTVCIDSSWEDEIEVYHEIIDAAVNVDNDADYVWRSRNSSSDINLTVEDIAAIRLDLRNKMHKTFDEVVRRIKYIRPVTAKNRDGKMDSYDAIVDGISLNVIFKSQYKSDGNKLYLEFTWRHKSVSDSAFEKEKIAGRIIEDMLYSFARNDNKDSIADDFAYRRFVDNVRNNGWKVIGIGIMSNAGKDYIGNDNFTTITNRHDINETFVKELEKVF